MLRSSLGPVARVGLRVGDLYDAGYPASSADVRGSKNRQSVKQTPILGSVKSSLMILLEVKKTTPHSLGLKLVAYPELADIQRWILN